MTFDDYDPLRFMSLPDAAERRMIGALLSTPRGLQQIGDELTQALTAWSETTLTDSNDLIFSIGKLMAGYKNLDGVEAMLACALNNLSGDHAQSVRDSFNAGYDLGARQALRRDACRPCGCG